MKRSRRTARVDDMRHPDEGEIHAWLDGALDPATAAGLEAHVAACPACSAAVAEARGLIAGASRILMALDGVPGGVLPAASQPPRAPISDDLAARRSEQQGDTRGTVRRPIAWYARRPIQVAAGLMLAVGIGSVVARNEGGSPDQMTVEFESVPPTPGPSVGRTSAPAPSVDFGAAAAAAEVGGVPILSRELPSANSNRAPSLPAATPAVAQKSATSEDQAARQDRTGVAEAGQSRVAEERSVRAAVAAAPPPAVLPTVTVPTAPSAAP